MALSMSALRAQLAYPLATQAKVAVAVAELTPAHQDPWVLDRAGAEGVPADAAERSSAMAVMVAAAASPSSA